jgi:hypothetical protein
MQPDPIVGRCVPPARPMAGGSASTFARSTVICRSKSEPAVASWFPFRPADRSQLRRWRLGSNSGPDHDGMRSTSGNPSPGPVCLRTPPLQSRLTLHLSQVPSYRVLSVPGSSLVSGDPWLCS